MAQKILALAVSCYGTEILGNAEGAVHGLSEHLAKRGYGVDVSATSATNLYAPRFASCKTSQHEQFIKRL